MRLVSPRWKVRGLGVRWRVVECCLCAGQGKAKVAGQGVFAGTSDTPMFLLCRRPGGRRLHHGCWPCALEAQPEELSRHCQHRGRCGGCRCQQGAHVRAALLLSPFLRLPCCPVLYST